MSKRIAAGLLAAAAAGYFGYLRGWHMTWGATGEEASGHLAGDELMPHPGIVATRAVEIAAPPSAIWPWLVQMGPGRGGAYTYDWIERRLGIDIRNVGHIVPELQTLKVGDEIPMPGYAMRVELLDPGRAMVIRSSNHGWVWSFELRPAAAGHTRLISRNRFNLAAIPRKDLLAYPVIEPGSWVMERKMLLTIKRYAERLARAQREAPALSAASRPARRRARAVRVAGFRPRPLRAMLRPPAAGVHSFRQRDSAEDQASGGRLPAPGPAGWRPALGRVNGKDRKKSPPDPVFACPGGQGLNGVAQMAGAGLGAPLGRRPPGAGASLQEHLEVGGAATRLTGLARSGPRA